jgi:uncharacterized membrane protein YtjA (UPF0391 family)
MFGRILGLLIAAIGAAMLGMVALAGTAVWIARKLFVVGLAALLIWRVTRRRPPAP